MSATQLGFLGTFVFGTLFGIVITIAIFRSSVAVVEKNITHIEQRIERHEKDIEKHRGKLADVMLKIGARRWSDPPSEE